MGSLGCFLASVQRAPSAAVAIAEPPPSPFVQMMALNEAAERKAASLAMTHASAGPTAPQRKASPRRRDDGDDDYAPVAGPSSSGRSRAAAAGSGAWDGSTDGRQQAKRPRLDGPTAEPVLPPSVTQSFNGFNLGNAPAPAPPQLRVPATKAAKPRSRAPKAAAAPKAPKPPKEPKAPKRISGRSARSKAGANAIQTLAVPERPVQLGMIGDKPPIWCETRQELCETLPYFKSYQGGHYTQDGRIWGYLLDGFPGPLDAHRTDLRVIISHGGGSSAENDAADDDSASTSTKSGSRFSLSSSQSRNHFRIRALEKNCKERIPLVLLAGVKYEGAPWLEHLGVRYAVLGHYLVTHCWATPEVVQRKTDTVHFTRFYFRFEWLEAQAQPWWYDLATRLPMMLAYKAEEARDAFEQSQRPIPWSLTEEGIDEVTALVQQYGMDEDTEATAAIGEHTCLNCSNVSPIVFAQAALCLNETCTQYGKHADGTAVIHSDLEYAPGMLQPNQLGSDAATVDIQLLPRTIDDACLELETYDKLSMAGTHCRDCGKISVRKHWTSRECSECGEATRRSVRHHVVPVDELRTGPRVPHQKVDDIVHASYATEDGAQINVYSLPDPEGVEGVAAGRVIHVSFDGHAERLATADSLFESFQREATFERGEMRAHRLAGRLLTQHFSLNAGEPYFYCAKSPSVSFADAPPAVDDSLRYIRDIVQQVLPRVTPEPEPVEFNEVLSIGYMASQSMSFHDDGEHDVARVVASLSYGSDALMEFRPKSSKKLAKLRKSAGVPAVRASGPLGRIALRLTLRHGDVLIMQGEDLQKLYEHAVSPHGFRFAATARYIYAKPSDRPPARPILMPGAPAELADIKQQLPSLAPTRESSPAPTKHKRKRSVSTASVPIKRESGSPAVGTPPAPPLALDARDTSSTISLGVPGLPPFQLGPTPPPGQHSLPPLSRVFAPIDLPGQTPSYRHESPTRPAHEMLMPRSEPSVPMIAPTGSTHGSTLAKTPAHLGLAKWPASSRSPAFASLAEYSMTAPTPDWSLPKRPSGPFHAI